MESRFSLNEQFAATRRDYEFADDDASTYASSIWERATTAEDGDQDDTVVLGHAQLISDPAIEPHKRGVVLRRSHYELLCLPEDTDLSPADIFKAYHRLFEILQPERQPQALGPVAQSLLNTVQEAFQTLIEPYRRVAYDLSNHKSPADAELPALVAYETDDTTSEGGLREAYLNLSAGEIVSSTDLGLRLDASRTSRNSKSGGEPKWRAPSPVDLQLRQSMTLAFPSLGKGIQKLVTAAQGFVQSRLPDAKRQSSSISCATPTVTVIGGVHGFLDEPYRLLSVLTDRYQPPGPSIHAQRNLEQLIASRFLPVVNAKLRQEFATKHAAGQREMFPDTVLETEVALFPEPAVTTRVAHAIDLPGGGHPVDVEVRVTKYGATSTSPPLVGLALHRQIASGTGFLTIDTGDWTLRPAEECLHFSKFSTLTKRFANTRNPFRSAPTVEVGYTVSSYDLGLRSGRGFTQPADRGVRGMDVTMDDDPSGSWTVSVGATAETVAGYMRYGRDVLSSLSPGQTAVLPPGNRAHRGSGFRAEVELGSSRSWYSPQQADYLALRALKRAGRFSKFGFEVGVSPSNLHLSLYWSRPGQRINIPFLLATKSSMSTELVFWATVLPFFGFGVAEIFSRSRTQRKLKVSRQEKSKANLQEYVARRRAEADELTVVLANGVEPRQRAERQAGGLVILSAKYSVRGATSEEVADVTVAVAALVDKGELYIPGGLRKSHLLGFWDPAPLDSKVLFVRYLYRGKENAVEVAGKEELRLPHAGKKDI
jgi:DnaJ family protein C protein 11